MNLNLGHTQDIIAVCKQEGLTTPHKQLELFK